METESFSPPSPSSSGGPGDPDEMNAFLKPMKDTNEELEANVQVQI